MKHVNVRPDGVRLGYVELDGTDPPLIFLHGLGNSSAYCYASTAARPVLAQRRRLLFDLLGFGVSDRPGEFGYTLEEHADSVSQALDTLGFRAVDMVAHSLGGAVALIVATQRPDLVARLVVVEPNLERSARPRIEPFTEASFVERGFELALAVVGPDWAATMRLADPVALYRTELALGTMTPTDALLLDLPVACAIIEGEHTAGLGDDPRIRAAGIPVVEVAGAGHMMMLEAPAAFAEAIHEALTTLTPMG